MWKSYFFKLEVFPSDYKVDYKDKSDVNYDKVKI